MKTLFYKMYIRLFLLMGFVLFASCEDLVRVDLSRTELSKSNVFEDTNAANSAMRGVYVRIIQNSLAIGYSGPALFGGLSADEIYSATSTTYQEFEHNIVSPASATINTNIWLGSYNLIYHLNSIIEGLEASSSIEIEVKERLIGEAKFVRAFYYFYLINLFGDVPLVLSTNYLETQKSPRTSVDEVYNQIKTDLLNAQLVLGENYQTASKGRPNKHAASALLARVYLYLGEYEGAERESSKVINSTRYEILEDLDAVFLINSNEAIWQLATNTNTQEGPRYIPLAGRIPPYPITTHLMNDFLPSDKRREFWVREVVVNEQVFFYPFKYKMRSSIPLTEHFMMLRFAEQFFIRAEARAYLGDLNGAINDIDIIRERAGIGLFANNNQEFSLERILDDVYLQKRLEFFCEWGTRWLDLKRTEKVDEVLSLIKPNWTPFAALYPIPQLQINANPYLTQNPGYH